MTLALVVVFLAAPQWQSFTNTNFVNSIHGSDSLLVLATRGGVYFLDPTGPAVLRTVVNADGLPANTCLDLAVDSRGNVWCENEAGEILFKSVSSNRFVTIDFKEHVRDNDNPFNPPLHFFEDSKNRLWLIDQ